MIRHPSRMTSLDLEIAVSVPVLCWELPLGCRIYHHHPKMVRSLEQLSRVADRYHYVHLVSLDAQLQLAPLLAACCCYHLDSSGHRIHIVCHAVGTDDIPLSRGCIEAFSCGRNCTLHGMCYSAGPCDLSRERRAFRLRFPGYRI